MKEKSETGKIVVGFEGIYQVSNQGNVRSLQRLIKGRENRTWLVKGSLLKLWKTGNCDYKRVSLISGGQKSKKTMLVHRLVFCTFNDIKYKAKNRLIVVNHINHNKLDNRLSNLELITQKENCIKRYIHEKTNFISKK